MGKVDVWLEAGRVAEKPVRSLNHVFKFKSMPKSVNHVEHRPWKLENHPEQQTAEDKIEHELGHKGMELGVHRLLMQMVVYQADLVCKLDRFVQFSEIQPRASERTQLFL